MMQFSMLAQPVDKGWTIYTLSAVTLCVGNPRILLLDAYKVTWNTGKIDLLKGEKSRMEHSIRTIHKTTLEHLLNFKAPVVMGPWFVIIFLGFALEKEAL